MAAEDRPTPVTTDETLEDVESSEFITLEYEDGTSERCEVLGIFDCNDKEYVVLVPDSDDDSVYLYEYQEHDDGTFSLADIADDEEFAAVEATYEELMEEDPGYDDVDVDEDDEDAE